MVELLISQGDVNLGDDSGDNINVGGDFVSGLRPDVSDSFDLGTSGNKSGETYSYLDICPLMRLRTLQILHPFHFSQMVM